MIGAEAKIAEGYHAMKAGNLERAYELLRDVPHPRAKELLAEINAKRDANAPSDRAHPANRHQ